MTATGKNYLFAFFGGGLGAAARYWLSGVVYDWLPASFSYGDLVVNSAVVDEFLEKAGCGALITDELAHIVQCKTGK